MVSDQRRPAGKHIERTQARRKVARKIVTHNQAVRRPLARKLIERQRRRRNTAEAALEELPLMAGGVPGPLAILNERFGWKLFLRDEMRRSFVSYRPAPFDTALLKKWWGQLEQELAWERPRVGDGLLPRSAAWLTQPGCTCPYAYTGTRWPSASMPKWFLELTDEVCRVCGLKERPNSCNANFYADGSQSVGWHSDDEPLFAATRRDALIISLSLGDSRTFEIRPNGASSPEVKRIRLQNGDILAMEGLMQKHYRHRIPRAKKAAPRINLTWRWIVQHDACCEQSCSRVDRLLEECQSLQLAVIPAQTHQSSVALPSGGDSAKDRQKYVKPDVWDTCTSIERIAFHFGGDSSNGLQTDVKLGTLETCTSMKSAASHNEPRMKRTSASGDRLCLRECFINPATCMCKPL